MKTEVKALLAPVVEALNKGDQTAVQLWAILTALRGPDSGDTNLKEETTSRLRYAVGLRGCALENWAVDGWAHISDEPLPTFTEMEEKYPTGSSDHFMEHFKQALKAYERS